jgi:tetratricopeptide (TPR) repeat protein
MYQRKCLWLLVVLLSGCSWLPTWKSESLLGNGPDMAPVPSLSVPLTGPAPVKKDDLPDDQLLKLALVAGDEFMKQGHDAEAIQQFERARRLDAKAPVARKLARLYERQGQFSQALAEYKLALEQSPQDADLCNDVGYCYFQMGNYVQAEHWLKRSRNLKSGHARASVNLGMAVGMQNRHAEALRLFQEVLSPADAYSNLAFVYLKQGRRTEAIEAYQQALLLQPDHKLAASVLPKLKGAGEPQQTSAFTPVSVASDMAKHDSSVEIQQVSWKPAGPRVQIQLEAPIAGKATP